MKLMTTIMSIAIANPNRLQKRMTSHPLEVWMLLPFTEEELQEAMASIGSPDEYGDYYLSGAETCGYEINPPFGTSITELNEVAKRIAALQEVNHWEAMKLAAYLEAHPNLSLEEIHCVLNEGFEDYDLLVGLTTFMEFKDFCFTQYKAYDHLPWELIHYLESDGKINPGKEIYHTFVGTLMRAS